MKPLGFSRLEFFVLAFVLFVTIKVVVPRLGTNCGGPSRRFTCQTNLKQVAHGLQQYAQDFDDTFPPHYSPNSGTLLHDGLTLNHWAAAIYPYNKSFEVFQCPSENNRLGTDYYLSRVMSSRTLKTIPHSASTVLLTEGDDTPQCDLATAPVPVIMGTSRAYARHLDGSNYAFVDGHVKWLSSTAAAKKGLLTSGSCFGS